MIPLQIVLVLLIVGSLVFYIACALFTWRFVATSRWAERDRPAVSSPKVALLVPVCGVDNAAQDNWTSLCQQDYAPYEVWFGVVDPQDPAVPLLQHLATTFPDRVRLLMGLAPRGTNHKDSTLSYLLDATTPEILVFADSDIRVSPHYLSTVIAPLSNPQVGLVTCAFIGHHPQFATAALASLGRGCDFIPSALIAQALDGGLKFAVGATMAMRRSILSAAGGLHYNRIGSDYNLGKRIAQAGYRVVLSHYLLESDTGQESGKDLLQRELRWARTIRFNRGWIYYSMIFCYGTVLCLPLLFAAKFQLWAIGLTLVTWLVRVLQATLCLTWLDCPRLGRWLWLLPVRDLLSFIVWIAGAYGDRVYWRGRSLRISEDGIVTPVDA